MKLFTVNKSFANRMFVSVVGIFLLLAILFLVFQFQRETDYKVDILHNRLQVVNYEVGAAYPDTLAALPEHCRVTIIALDGKVLYDNQQSAANMDNHSDRQEVRQALKSGTGYDIQRNSESMGEKFFYSATLFPEKRVVVRSALPYNSQLYKDLTIDKTFIFFIVISSVVLCIVLYQIAKRLAESEQQKLELEKQALKRQLTQNAAHELKTPTASISAYLETLLTTPDLPDETRRHFLERSFAQSQRMSSILSDLSSLASMDEVRQVQAPMRINMQELIEQVHSDVSLALEKARMTFRSDVEDITVLGDRSLLYSVFRNLFDNAIAYAGEGSTLTVSVLMHRDGFAEFTVADNGKGVPAVHLPRLCERFYRIDKGRSRELGGTGLGLAIVKNAILLHGGEVRLLPTPSGGLTIRFTLPTTKG